ncbi:MAG: hypothetical protein WC455_16165 [Dehalococcoidia bacterium]|jgi:DNA repair exonuclease SbcCD ATPase subunit
MISINSETGEILRDRSDYWPPDEVRALIRELCLSRNAKNRELEALKGEGMNTCRWCGSVVSDSWTDERCPHCNGQLKSQAELLAAKDRELAALKTELAVARKDAGHAYEAYLQSIEQRNIALETRFAVEGALECSEKTGAKIDKDLSALRAELAEAGRLLRECRRHTMDFPGDLIDNIDAYLCAHPAPPTIASDGSKG